LWFDHAIQEDRLRRWVREAPLPTSQGVELDNTIETRAVVGIDVCRDTLDVAVLDGQGRVRGRSQVTNDPSGWEALLATVKAAEKRLGVERAECAMESTGDFHQHAERVLRGAERTVHVLNPLSIKGFARAMLKDVKTDRGDAELIARYVVAMKPEAPWTPPEGFSDLRELTRLRRSFIEDRTQVKNRLHRLLRGVLPGYRGHVGAKLSKRFVQAVALHPTPAELLRADRGTLLELGGPGVETFVTALVSVATAAPRRELPTGVRRAVQVTAQRILDLNELITEFDADIQSVVAEVFPDQQLTSIPGVGPVTSACVLAEVGDISRFASKRAFVGYCGLYPVVWESGTVRRTFRMSWKGNKHLKTALLLATASARRYNPAIKAMYDRLRARHKSKRAAGGAIARKLAEYIFVVLSRGVPWDPDLAARSIEKAQQMSEA
jgi:transposase